MMLDSACNPRLVLDMKSEIETCCETTEVDKYVVG